MSNTLPKPLGRQREVLYLPASGHTVVLGTAGSGKTTLAILRAAHLADRSTDHGGRTLLVTFNKALVTYLKSFQGPDLSGVDVHTYDVFARGYLNAHGLMRPNSICGPRDRLALCKQAIGLARDQGNPSRVLTRPAAVLAEEFQWIAHHGIRTEGQYLEAERAGRGSARIERQDRPAVFGAYLNYRSLRQNAGKEYDWDDLAQAVHAQLELDTSPRRYRHVIIDEGQDFSPEMLRSLALAIPQDGSLTFFGDMAQQIYGQRMSWRDAGLQLPKIWYFKENYRNSRQIARLALAIAQLPVFPDDPDLVEPVAPKADGVLPALVRCRDQDEETRLVLATAVSRSKSQSVAILLRNRRREAQFKAKLPSSAVRLHRMLNSWQGGPGLYYGTYHSAKGLEFDLVLLPGLTAEALPPAEDVKNLGFEDAASRDAKLLYVAVTRARADLILTVVGEKSALLPPDAGLYQESRR